MDRPLTSGRDVGLLIATAAALVAVAVAGCASADLQPSKGTPSERPAASRGAPSAGSPADEAFRPTGPTETARVVRIVDGDTIVVRRGRGRDEHLRYIGMDTPETKQPNTPIQWMGPEATAANAALVEGRSVVLEKDVSDTDHFGRLLRYVWLVDGERWTMVDLELVRRGFAQVETDPPDVKYADRFVEAQRAARRAGSGLWGPHPATTP